MELEQKSERTQAVFAIAPSQQTSPQQTSASSVNDFDQLREKLHHISEQHLQSLWAEKGGMWEALNNRHMGTKYFSQFRPDIRLMHLTDNASPPFKNFIQAFSEAHIRGLPLKLTLSGEELQQFNELLSFVIDALLDHAAIGLNSRLSQENVSPARRKVESIRTLLNNMTPIQWEDFIGTLDSEKQALIAQYDHERFRYLTTRSVIELPTNEYPHYAYEQLAKLYRNEVDDFSLFNGAYGPANSALDENDPNFSGHRTPYQVYNGVIKEIRLQFAEPRDVNPDTENHRWEAIVALTSETTSYHKAIAPGKPIDPFSSIADVVDSLENLIRPLLFLKTKQDCQGITKEITALYDESYDAIFQYLYFSKPEPTDKRRNHQQSVADFFGIPLSSKGLNQQAFVQAIAQKAAKNVLPVYKQQLAEIIVAFATGKISHIGFQGKLKLLATSYRPKSAWSRLMQYCWALVIPKMGAISALRQQYQAIDYLNSKIRHGYKMTRANMDINIANSNVNATLKVTVPQIRTQDKTDLLELHWLNERGKQKLQEMVPGSKNLTTIVAQQSNPIYASALSKLLFFASQPLQQASRQLTSRVTQTINAHERIIEAPKGNITTVPQTTIITRDQLKRAIFLSRQWESKAKVSSYLLETLDKENNIPRVPIKSF